MILEKEFNKHSEMMKEILLLQKVTRGLEDGVQDCDSPQLTAMSRLMEIRILNPEVYNMLKQNIWMEEVDKMESVANQSPIIDNKDI